MNRFAQCLGSALLLAGTALIAACSGSPSGLVTGAAGPDGTGAIKNDDPMARPVSVAWTSARAKRCGFFFDGPKLRTSYLAWEAGKGAAGEQLAKIEKSYDTTFAGTWSRVSADEGYCTDKKGGEIKADLQRYLAGDYTPNLPQPKVVASCGFFGCGSGQGDEPFESKKFYEKMDKQNVKR